MAQLGQRDLPRPGPVHVVIDSRNHLKRPNTRWLRGLTRWNQRCVPCGRIASGIQPPLWGRSTPDGCRPRLGPAARNPPAPNRSDRNRPCCCSPARWNCCPFCCCCSHWGWSWSGAERIARLRHDSCWLSYTANKEIHQNELQTESAKSSITFPKSRWRFPT